MRVRFEWCPNALYLWRFYSLKCLWFPWLRNGLWSYIHKEIDSLTPYIFATQRRRSEIFQTMNPVRSNNLSLKYQRITTSGCKDIRIR